MLGHAQLKQRIPDLRNGRQAIGWDRCRNGLELPQRLLRLARGGECGGGACPSGQRRGVIDENPPVDVELLVELLQLLVAQPEREIDLPRDVGQAHGERPHLLELLSGLRPPLPGDQQPALEQPHGGARGAVEFFDPSNDLVGLLEVVLLQEHVGEHEEQRGFPGEFRRAFAERPLGSREIVSLQGDGRQAAIHPFVRGKERAGFGSDRGGLFEILTGEGQFERTEDHVDVVGGDCRRLLDILGCRVEVGRLPMPAGHRQPGLRVGATASDQFLEHAVGRRRVGEPLLQDRGEQDVGVGRVGRRLGRIESPLGHVVADQLAGQLRRHVELASARERLRHQQLDRVGVDHRLFGVVILGLLERARFESRLEHVEVLAGIDGAADPQLKLGQFVAERVLFGIAANRLFERVVGP